ncbi:MAG: hypothetical protein UU82_C0007G0031 [Candidatus Nomurabacteria bacterium GW2011_GWC2_41_8]|uniref:Uncharacterized protein n=3 Tax=Candidatus Nomuraibacteriota TaxID=1752729 RepID=A0A1F6Y9Y5_9BACT|nr:MAG: hypothetical protein UU58_C0003G0012 [Candidatus Nomurabacteria bacterium GW2011_GWA2_41_25]KKS24360.1 MAG: hypothetical protein UU82_C0007G0031 [Candidatus Nomurabacteria bacterium GW2011_GWC2_41_8]OGI67140.1 MAG: hypothetical protein A2823_01775 [Candidatus Nomurabacteria bacterium RIFCSPHIGHO2_01_FULL_41_91]OGI80269.1 MAG: hypothetical protein A3D43_01160 [Candidatus Nomurabacteria bacterium RIFCSPHIGHO2_02_FULL_41_52]OGI94167.1 MAG: hypothetical protein A3A07_00195 [Candidatus Nomur
MPMSKSILITRPDHDLITKYFCAWSNELVDFAKSKMIKVYDLKGKKSNKKKFLSYINIRCPSLIFLNGHGNADIFAGYGDEPMVGVETILKDAIVYARSCEVGKNLGLILVQNGAHSFIGYNRKFFCGYTPEKITKPLEDEIAGLFLKPSNLIISTLLKSNSVQEAHNRSRKSMYKNFRKMVSSTSTFEERYSARWLWSNLHSQVIFGDPLKTI